MFKTLIFQLLSPFMRRLFPANNYWLARRSLQPLSSRFGFDRGSPIDRFWIEKFLSANSSHIRGRVLEITDDNYTRKYGGQKIRTSDVLDIDPGNRRANIHGDLKSLPGIKNNTYDCVILTHVLGLIDDVFAVSSEIHRILRPGGILLFTSSCLGPVLGEKIYWRFTPNSVNFIFKNFRSRQVKTYGNVLAGQAFWVGMAQQDLDPKELDYNDPRYPCIVTLKAVK